MRGGQRGAGQEPFQNETRTRLNWVGGTARSVNNSHRFDSEKVLAPRLADLRALAPIGARGFILSRIDHSPLSRLVSLSYPESKEEGKEEEKREAEE